MRAKDSDRYKVAKCIQAEPVFCGFGRSAHSKVISVSVLTYYSGYNTITQNSAGDIVFKCLEGKTHVYVSEPGYTVSFLETERVLDSHGYYIGTFYV